MQLPRPAMLFSAAWSPVDLLRPVGSTPGYVVASNTFTPSQQGGASAWAGGGSTNTKSFSRELMLTSRWPGEGTSNAQVLPRTLVRMPCAVGRTAQRATPSCAVSTTVAAVTAASRA